MESKLHSDQPPLLENEDSYKQWRKAISLWAIVSDIPKEKQAIAVTLSLKGKARQTALEINIDDLNSDNGMEVLLRKLDEMLNVNPMKIYDAFRAFDSLEKQPFDTCKTYAKNFITLYDRLKEAGVDFSEKFLTLKLLSGAQLSAFEAVDIQRRTKEGSLGSAIMNLICYVDDLNKFDFKPAGFKFSAVSSSAKAGLFNFGIKPRSQSSLEPITTVGVTNPTFGVQKPRTNLFEAAATKSSKDPGTKSLAPDATSKKSSDAVSQFAAKFSENPAKQTTVSSLAKAGLFNFGIKPRSQSSLEPLTTVGVTNPTFGVQKPQTNLFRAAATQSSKDPETKSSAPDATSKKSSDAHSQFAAKFSENLAKQIIESGSKPDKFVFSQPKFSIGISAKTTSEYQDTQSVKTSSNPISPPKFISGESGSSTREFRTSQSNDFKKSEFGTGNHQSTNVSTKFDSDISSNSAHSNKTSPLSPRFSSVEGDDDSSEYNTSSSDSYYETTEYDKDDAFGQNKEASLAEKQTIQSIPDQTDQFASEQTAHSESDKTTESASKGNSSEDNRVFGSLSSSDQNVGFKKNPGFQFPKAGQGCNRS